MQITKSPEIQAFLFDAWENPGLFPAGRKKAGVAIRLRISPAF
jgi:hypothetical protein